MAGDTVILKRILSARLRILAVAALLHAVVTTPAAAQTFVLQGAVVDRSSQEAISNATVRVAGRTLLTDARGRFRFQDVPAGSVSLSVAAIGYLSLERTIVVTGDTAVILSLQVSPVELGPVTAEARHITVRGQVVEPDHQVGVIDTEVWLGGARDRTDLLGRFRFNGVPAGVPVRLWTTAFGYLPVDIPFEASRDTTVRIVLQHDSVAVRMIQEQLARISRRSAARRYEFFEGLNRDDLLKGRDRGTFVDLLQNLAGTNTVSRIACIVIDESEVYDSRTRVDGPLLRRRAGRLELAPQIPPLLPDEIYHLELVALPEPFEPLVLRIYTRDFMQELVAGGGSLVEAHLATSREGGRCR